MEKMIRSFGRTELAQRYFPGLTPDGAWHKLRAAPQSATLPFL